MPVYLRFYPLGKAAYTPGRGVVSSRSLPRVYALIVCALYRLSKRDSTSCNLPYSNFSFTPWQIESQVFVILPAFLGYQGKRIIDTFSYIKQLII